MAPLVPHSPHKYENTDAAYQELLKKWWTICNTSYDKMAWVC